VSMRSFKPYLWGLSSGSGEGAGIEGDSVSPRCGGGTGAPLDLTYVSSSSSSTNEVRVSTREPLRLSTRLSRMVVEALSGRSESSLVKVALDAECIALGMSFDLRGESALPSMNTGLSSSSLWSALWKAVGEIC